METLLDHPVLDHLTFGYGSTFDARRQPHTARLTVFANQPGGVPDIGGLVAAVETAWPAGAGALSFNLTSETWLAALLEAGAPAHWHIEVPAFMATDPARAERLQALAQGGQTLVLTGRATAPMAPALRACFKYAVADLRDETPGSPGGGARPGGDLPFVQAGCETPGQVAACFRAGARAVMGWPLGDAPDETTRSRAVPAGVQIVMDLMQRVDNEEPAARLDAVLRKDPTLAFRLMRYINSPAFGLSVEIGSFQHALMILGYRRLKRWLALLLAGAIDDPDLKPMMGIAVRRGLLMEALMKADADPLVSQELFICGVFSLLDRMLGQTFGKLLDALPVPDRVRQALTDGSGPYRPYLDLACAVEMEALFDIRACTEALMISSGEANLAVLKALGDSRQSSID